MKVKLLLVVVIIALSALIVFNFDYATSVVPGWHITVYPPFFIAGFFFYWFLLVVILYLIFFRKTFTRNDVIFYLAMTLPLLILIQFLKFADGYIGEWQLSLTILTPLFIILAIAYFVAQVWMLVKMGRIGFRRMRE